MVELYLTKEGYRVSAATNGAPDLGFVIVFIYVSFRPAKTKS